jgi:hypothetical protein
MKLIVYIIYTIRPRKARPIFLSARNIVSLPEGHYWSKPEKEDCP